MVVMDDVISTLKSKGLALKIVEGLKDYLSCKIKLSGAWLGQPHLIKIWKRSLASHAGCSELQDSMYA